MQSARYFIAGSSHAALEAAAAIRMFDPEGSLVMATADHRLPYSPTVLPYVVSGRTAPEGAILRDAAWMDANHIGYLAGRPVAAVDILRHRLSLADGEVWGFEKLLVASGARPVIPPIPGIDSVAHYVLRSMEDAIALKAGLGKARRAVVLGAGLVGLHAAETMVKADIAVTVVEMRPQVLPGYFDSAAARFIEETFLDKGVAMMMGVSAVSVAAHSDGFVMELSDGATIEGDLLLVAAGVRPVTDFLAGTGVEIGQGILVDPRMRTSTAGIWAAGDVTQHDQFLDDRKAVAGILPNAVEQGRIAGADMAGDSGYKPFPGAVPLNTFTFFGNRAVSVGVVDEPGAWVMMTADMDKNLRIVMANNRLRGISVVNHPLDAGIMWQLILRRVDLTQVLADFVARPTETGRAIMSGTWR